jgi:hypothetical protein
MTRPIAIALTATAILLQIPGCHYYIDATPRITVSSQPFTISNSHSSTTPVTPEAK